MLDTTLSDKELKQYGAVVEDFDLKAFFSFMITHIFI